MPPKCMSTATALASCCCAPTLTSKLTIVNLSIMKPHPTAKKLLTDIALFRRATGMGRTAFGLGAVGDGYFLRRLESGREPRHDTVERVRQFMRGKVRYVRGK